MKVTYFCLLAALLSISGCKSTLDGAVDAVSNLAGNDTHSSFDGTFIDQPTVAEYKNREDKLSGEGRVISYSGMDIPAEQVRTSHVVHAPELNAYLNTILDNILAQWDGTPVNVQVQVVHSQNFAPYADAFGMVSIPMGALANIESEDELALLISHEVSHILMRHHERDAVVQENKKNVDYVAKAVVMANVVRDYDVVKAGGRRSLQYTPSEQSSENISQAMIYNAVIQTVSDSVWNTAWKRKQEDEADLLGFDLAVRAGYSPRANDHVLERLKDFQGKQQGMLSKFWDQKKTAMTAALQGGDFGALSTEVDTFLAQGLSAGLGAVTEFFQQTHISPEERQDNLKEYTLKNYRPEIRRHVNVASWQEVKSSAEVTEVLTSYRRAFEAANALASNDTQNAERLAMQSLTPRVKNHPYLREVMYNVRKAQGDHVRANKNLALIERWQDASPSLYEVRIQQLFDTKDFDGALTTIESAEEVFGSESMFLIQKSIALANQGKQDEALDSLEKCEKYDSLKADCAILKEQFG